MVLQIIYIFKWLTWLSNDIQIISIMSPDKDILENCLFNSENLLQQERWGKRDGIKEERAGKSKEFYHLFLLKKELVATIKRITA